MGRSRMRVRWARVGLMALMVACAGLGHRALTLARHVEAQARELDRARAELEALRRAAAARHTHDEQGDLERRARADEHQRRGIERFEAFDYAAAVAPLERALELDPRREGARTMLLQARLLAGLDVPEIVPLVETLPPRRARAGDADDEGARELAAGEQAYRALRYREAAAHLERAVALGRDDAAARDLLARVRWIVGERRSDARGPWGGGCVR